MLGMGGSQLYIPILYWLGMDFVHEAVPLGLALNVVVASSAATTYLRHGMVRIRLAVPFAVTMVVAAPVGAFFALDVAPRLVIGAFALFTLSGALIVLSGWTPRHPVKTHRAEILLGVGAGAVLGFLVGFTGRGGGAMVVPVLIVGPYLAWDPAAMFDDVWRWSSGTSPTAYQIWGWGASNLLLALGWVQSRFDYWPFWLPQLLVGIPLMAGLLWRQMRDNRLARALWSYGLFLFAFFFVSRFLNENYLGYVLAFLVLGTLVEVGDRG